jgi:hypothetical protein
MIIEVVGKTESTPEDVEPITVRIIANKETPIECMANTDRFALSINEARELGNLLLKACKSLGG